MSTRVYGRQIGSTPLIKIDKIWAKLETKNPSGSVKDRMVWYMVDQAEKKGLLKPGSRIIEATSGNTGISLALVSALKGYKFTAVMPESMSIERRQIMNAFGAELVLTPAEKDMKGAIEKYNQLIKKHPDAWLPDQFNNPDNIEAHRKGLGKEIIEQKPDLEAFIAGMGTGGTLIGVAKALKEHNPDIRTIGIEPEESAVLSGKEPGPHEIQGIGEGFVPRTIRENRKYIDQIVTVSSKAAKSKARELAKKGIFVGISSGANVHASQSLPYSNVVTILPDGGEKYISTGLYR